jgi:imidazolonepropionase
VAADAGLLVVRGIGELLTMAGPEGGDSAGAFSLVKDAALVVEGGRVAYAGPEDQARVPPGASEVDVAGRIVSPGLVDAHTHLMFAGSRAHEVALRARGAGYLEILEAGGGILATVEATRRASDAELLSQTRARLHDAIRAGATTIEVKTGYALDPEGELRLLGLLELLRAEGPWRLVITYLGAHALPPEHRGHPAEFLSALSATHPEVARRADFVDLFLEPGVFAPDVAAPYIADAKRHGLKVKVHVDELQDGGGAEHAARWGAVSADHLAYTSAAGIQALRRSGTVAVLLPGTAGYLHPGHQAPARALLDAGVPIAIASDGNPGSSPTSCLGTLLPWAAAWLHLTPEEVWTAATRGAARAVARPELGRLAPGDPADFVVWETDDYRVPCYRYGQNLVRSVYVGGRRHV